MNILDLIRTRPGFRERNLSGKIPWDEPGFSSRMLSFHLDQEHDWASRRLDLIEQQVRWLSGVLPAGSRILDLGCGPGLYTLGLARLGHICTGVDFSPASIAHARKKAADEGLTVTYLLEDVRAFLDRQTYGCVLMTFGEINVFSRKDALSLLSSAARMLAPGGLFLLEAHTYEAVRESGLAGPGWQRHESGLFSAQPHLLLQENGWDQISATATSRYFVLDAASATVSEFASCMQAYSSEEYAELLCAAGLIPTTGPDQREWPPGEPFKGKLQVLTATRKLD